MNRGSVALALLVWAGALLAQGASTPPPLPQGAPQQAGERVRQALAGPKEVPPPLAPAQAAELLRRQRNLVQEVSQAVGHPVQLLEDDHFIFLSDLPAGPRRQVLGWLKTLYGHLDRIFAASQNQERMWDGKLVVAVFGRRADYLKFALKLQDQQAAIFAGGHFHPQQDPTTKGLTASVAVPLPGEGPEALKHLRSILVHEVTHAFLYFWKRPGRTPLWLHEGTAMHMQSVADREDPYVGGLRRTARLVVDSGAGYPVELATEGLMPSRGDDTEGYAQALAMTEMLLAADSERYVRFVRLMKEGKPQKEALAEAYGWSYATLEKNWRAYVRQEY